MSRDLCQEYAREVQKLAYKLLGLIGQSLGLPENRLNGFFQGQTSFVRLNYYPPCPFPDLALGVGRHKDAGALTILAQDMVGGLQIRRKSDQQWIPVKPTPNAFIVNVGDIFQVTKSSRQLYAFFTNLSALPLLKIRAVLLGLTMPKTILMP